MVQARTFHRLMAAPADSFQRQFQSELAQRAAVPERARAASGSSRGSLRSKRQFQNLRVLSASSRGRKVRPGEKSGAGIVRCAVMVLSLAVAGCGYQIRGAVSLPPGLDAVHVAGPPEIGAALIEVLDSGGVRVRSNGDSAQAVVRLTEERFSRRLLSVDPDTGKEGEFEVSYRVTFRVTDPDGGELVPGQTVSLLRDYAFDSAALLGKNRERRTLHAEMRRDAAGQIARRILAALGQ